MLGSEMQAGCRQATLQRKNSSSDGRCVAQQASAQLSKAANEQLDMKTAWGALPAGAAHAHSRHVPCPTCPPPPGLWLLAQRLQLVPVADDDRGGGGCVLPCRPSCGGEGVCPCVQPRRPALPGVELQLPHACAGSPCPADSCNEHVWHRLCAQLTGMVDGGEGSALSEHGMGMQRVCRPIKAGPRAGWWGVRSRSHRQSNKRHQSPGGHAVGPAPASQT